MIMAHAERTFKEANKPYVWFSHVSGEPKFMDPNP